MTVLGFIKSASPIVQGMIAIAGGVVMVCVNLTTPGVILCVCGGIIFGMKYRERFPLTNDNQRSHLQML